MIRILVVEDVAPMQELIRKMLESIPTVEVSGTASNGWECRREILNHRPDLVLLDEVLPGESSGDLLAEIQRKGIPVFLITGMKDPSHSIPSGVLGRLQKPGWDSMVSDIQRFKSAIHSALGEK